MYLKINQIGVMGLETPGKLTSRCAEGSNDMPMDTQPGLPTSQPTNFSCALICWHLPRLIHKINAAVLN